MPIVIESLLVAELLLHVIGKQLQPLLVLKAKLLLKQVLLLSKLTPHSCLFFLKHLSEALFDEVAVVGELFFTLLGHLLVLARGTENDLHLLSTLGRLLVGWRARTVRGSRLGSLFVATTSAHMSITEHSVRIAMV